MFHVHGVNGNNVKIIPFLCGLAVYRIKTSVEFTLSIEPETAPSGGMAQYN